MMGVAAELKSLINNKKYKQSVQLLEQILIKYVVDAIKEKEEDFEYTDIYSLIRASNQFINDNRKNIAWQIRIFSFDIDDSENTYRLLEICQNYNIK